MMDTTRLEALKLAAQCVTKIDLAEVAQNPSIYESVTLRGAAMLILANMFVGYLEMPQTAAPARAPDKQEHDYPKLTPSSHER